MRCIAVVLALFVATPARAEPAHDERDLALVSGLVFSDAGALFMFAGIMRGTGGDRSTWSAALLYGSLPLIAVSPSLGHFVTHDYLLGGAGVAANVAGMTIMWAADRHEQAIQDHLRATCTTSTCLTSHSKAAYGAEMLGGFALIVGASMFEIFDTPRVVRRYNLRVAPLDRGVALAGAF